MRCLITAILAIGFCFTLSAQKSEDKNNRNEKRTLLNGQGITGGFVGLTMKSGEVGNNGALWVGGETGVIFGNDFGFGFAGYGLVNSVKTGNLTADGKSLYYQSGYGGLLFEPAIFENNVINISFPTVLGAGGAIETRAGGIIDEWGEYNVDDDEFRNGEAFWVLEPGAAVNLNITRWMKLTGGLSYRWLSNMNLPESKKYNLNGLNGSITLKLGWF